MIASIPSYHSPEAARDRIVALCGCVDHLRVLDVGCGDGLIGRALLPMVGAGGSVTFVDRDPSTVQQLASTLEQDSRSRTVVNDARDLSAIDSESVDLVVMRAVLLYIADKRAALCSVARVLRPNGRLVLSEPVNRPLYYPAERFWGFDLASIPDIATKLQHGFTNARGPEIRAMSDWDDTSLAAAVVDSGLSKVRMETFTEYAAGRSLPWLSFLHARWTPWLPSLAQVISEHLTSDEAHRFEQVVRPQLASGQQHMPFRTTFITSTRK